MVSTVASREEGCVQEEGSIENGWMDISALYGRVVPPASQCIHGLLQSYSALQMKFKKKTINYSNSLIIIIGFTF